jgi:hypothetical protein
MLADPQAFFAVRAFKPFPPDRTFQGSSSIEKFEYICLTMNKKSNIQQMVYAIPGLTECRGHCQPSKIL